MRILLVDFVIRLGAVVGVIGEVALDLAIADARHDLHPVAEVDRVLHEIARPGADGELVAALVESAVLMADQGAVVVEPGIGDVAVVVDAGGGLGLTMARALEPDAGIDLLIVEQPGGGEVDARAIGARDTAAIDQDLVETVAVAVHVGDATAERGSARAFGQRVLFDAAGAVAVPEVRRNTHGAVRGDLNLGLRGGQIIFERIHGVLVIRGVRGNVGLRRAVDRRGMLRRRGRIIPIAAVGGELRQAHRHEVVVVGTVVQQACAELDRTGLAFELQIDVIAISLALAFELVDARFRVGQEGFVIADQAGVVTHEGAMEIELAEALRDAQTMLVFRRARDEPDIAARGAHMRRFGIARALRDEQFAQVFAVGVFLRIDGEVARVVDRRAVDREAHLVAVETAHAQGAAEQAGGIGARCIHAGREVEQLERVGRGTRLVDRGLGHRALGLGQIFFDQLPGAELVAFAGDDDLADFGRLLRMRGGDAQAGGGDGDRHRVEFVGLHGDLV